jgi:hypothetical protein
VLLLFPSPYVIAHTFTKREERERNGGSEAAAALPLPLSDCTSILARAKRERWGAANCSLDRIEWIKNHTFLSFFLFFIFNSFC